MIDAWRPGHAAPAVAGGLPDAFAWLASGGAAEPEKAMREARASATREGSAWGRVDASPALARSLSGLRQMLASSEVRCRWAGDSTRRCWLP
ncbi:hypothetical protein ACPA9J_28050 [Pseudomonas aeruginosa]